MPQAQPELKKVRPPYRGHHNLPKQKSSIPDYLTQYLEKRLFVQLNGSRKIIGVLRGYDVRNQPPKLQALAISKAIELTIEVV